MRRLAVLAVTGLAACTAGAVTSPTTELLLIVDGTPPVRMHTGRLHVEISASSSREGPYTGTVVEDYGPPASPVGYPRRFGLVPLDGDAKRFFEARATAFDTSGMEITQSVVRSGYVAHELLELRITLDDACHGVTCPSPDEACRHGTCQPIFVDPGVLPQSDAGPPGPPDGGADGGVGVDGGPLPDGFVPPDATMPPPDGFVPPDATMPPPDAGPGCSAATCDDGNVCNGVETCTDGVCLPGTPLFCGDGVACTTDGCDPMAGCLHTPNDAACTIGLMLGTCDVAMGCQYAACDGTTCANDPSTCTLAHCVGTTCMRSSSCSAASVCCAGVCVAPGCDDGNPCTDDHCDTMAGCQHANNTVPCTDGASCTSPDVCGGGTCHAGPSTCDDHDPCTDDLCGVTGCTHTGNTAACDDGDPCTYPDHCHPASMGCIPGPSLSCDDGNDCTIDFCAPGGMCGTMNADGFSCTDRIDCLDGVCNGGLCDISGSSGCVDPQRCCNGLCQLPDLCF